MTNMFIDLDQPGEHREKIKAADTVRMELLEKEPEYLMVTVHEDGFDVEVTF